MSFRFLDNIVYADVAFEVEASTLRELFSDAGVALTAIQIKNYRDIKSKAEKQIELHAKNIEELLYLFLEELIFIKDTELLLFNKFDIDVKGDSLKGTAHGETLDAKRHQSIVDAKAVTMHLFKVEKHDGKYTARVIIDV